MPEGVAKLRLLLVREGARGFGMGGRLVHECTEFARSVRYVAFLIDRLEVFALLGVAHKIRARFRTRHLLPSGETHFIPPETVCIRRYAGSESTAERTSGCFRKLLL